MFTERCVEDERGGGGGGGGGGYIATISRTNESTM